MDSSLLLAEPEVCFTFGNLRLEPDGTLFRENEPIHLAPKELAALRVLLANPNCIVTAAQFRRILWPDVHVTSDSVPRCLSSLRSRLGSDAQIRTIYKRGYRLDSPVHRRPPLQQNSLPRLAILPFDVELCVPEFLGPAIAEEAATQLAAFQPNAAHVLARESISTLASQSITPLVIGQKLDADLVLTGTLQTSALFLRLRAKMTRVADGTQIWVEDLIAPREQPAVLLRRLLDRMIFRLGGQRHISIPAVAQETTENEREGTSFEAFLEGRHESRTRDPHRMLNAMQILRKAADLDRNRFDAPEQLIKLATDQCLYGFLSPLDAAEQIRREADALPEIGRTATTILPALGWIVFHVEHQLAFALRLFNAASGADTWSTRLRVMLALSRCRFDEALSLLDQALTQDPFSPALQIQLAWTHHLAGSVKPSLYQSQRCLALFPGDERAKLCAALILAFNDEPKRAVELAHDVAQRRPTLDIAVAIEAYALARADRRDEAKAILERLQWLGRERYVLRSFTAAAYAEMGEIDGAIEELQSAEQARCPWFFQTLADPRLNCLRGNPKFERMKRHLETVEASVSDEGEPSA